MSSLEEMTSFIDYGQFQPVADQGIQLIGARNSNTLFLVKSRE
jgi:hypothetical protein